MGGVLILARKKNARRVPRGDAVSDVVGTIILLGVTVTLVAAFAAGLNPGRGAASDAPHLDVVVTAGAGDAHVTLRHVGGVNLDEGELRVLVVVNGTTWYDDALGVSGDAWHVGETRHVTPLSNVLQAGDAVQVQVVSTPHGATIATGATYVPRTSPPSGAPPGDFNVTLSYGSGTVHETVIPPASLFLSADVDHPEGRKAIRSVTVDFSPLGDSPVTPLYDDGHRGDAVAGDGLYSGYLLVGTNATLGTFDIVATVTAFDGAQVTDVVQITVTDTLPFYNSALIHQFGFQVIKHANGGQSDAITAHLKIRVRDEPVRLDNGNWSLNKVWLEYEPFKPGQYKAKELNDGAEDLNEGWWHCAENGKRIKVFRMDEETIQMYRGNRDTIRFYFKLEWQNVDPQPGAPTEHITTIEASEVVQWFLLRPHEDLKEVRTSGWPGTFHTC